jgi:hypothetical protein
MFSDLYVLKLFRTVMFTLCNVYVMKLYLKKLLRYEILTLSDAKLSDEHVV